MGKNLVFRSMDKFEMHYFPEAYKKMKEAELMNDPVKFGRYVVDKAFENLKKGKYN